MSMTIPSPQDPQPNLTAAKVPVWAIEFPAYLVARLVSCLERPGGLGVDGQRAPQQLLQPPLQPGRCTRRQPALDDPPHMISVRRLY